MYNGEDRVQQVNCLQEIAAGICWGWVGEGSAEEMVTFFVEETRDAGELPDWFDDHDFDLLIEWVAASL